jgi:hypothetical protein
MHVILNAEVMLVLCRLRLMAFFPGVPVFTAA